MVHEVLTGDFVGNEQSGEGEYQRYGLCSSQIRRMMLGCAHTGANDRFLNLLRKLMAFPYSLRFSVYFETIENIILRIYMMDHKKGTLEKRKRMAGTQRDSNQFQEVVRQLDEIAAQHRILIEELEIQRCSVLEALKTIIDAYGVSN